MSQSIEIRVLGQSLRMRTDQGEQYAIQLAKHVENVAANIQKHTQNASSDRTILMTALHIANELFQLQEYHDAQRRQRNDLYQRLIATSDKLFNDV